MRSSRYMKVLISHYIGRHRCEGFAHLFYKTVPETTKRHFSLMPLAVSTVSNPVFTVGTSEIHIT